MKSESLSCFIRDGWKCRHCNDRMGIHPHHVIYKSQQGPDDLTNLLTLCWQCHHAAHEKKLLIEVVKLLENDLEVKFIRVKGWQPK